MKKGNALVGLLTNGAVIVLFALLLGLSVLFIRLSGVVEDTHLPPFPESGLRLLSGESDKAGAADAYLFSPAFLCASSDSCRYALTYSEEDDGELWQNFVRVLQNAPGGTAKKVAFSDAEKKAAYLDALYGSEAPYYYCRLPSAVPFCVLCALVSDRLSAIPENPDFAVRDLFLFCGSSGESYLAAVDPAGDVLKIYPARGVSFNKERLEAYNETGLRNFTFLKVEENAQSAVCPYFPVYTQTMTLYTARRMDREGSLLPLSDAASRQEFVSLFGMNPANTRSYEASDDSLVFVEDTAQLRVSREGFAEFMPQDGGNPLSRYLSYGIDTEAGGFMDVLSVSRTILARLGKLLENTDGRLLMTDLVRGGDGLEVRCRYSVDGIPVDTGRPYDAVLRFSQNSLLYGEVYLESFRKQDLYEDPIPQKLAYTLIREDLSGRVVSFGAEYTASEEEPDLFLPRLRLSTELTGDENTAGS